MEEKKHTEERKAWVVVDRGLERDARLKDKGVRLKGRHPALREGAWVLVLATDGRIQRIGQVLRIRIDVDSTALYFDKARTIEQQVSIGATGLVPPSTGSIVPAPWTEFAEAIPRALGITLADVPTIEDEAYIRELLQLAIMDDLLGPAGGPEELIVDMSVRDRYLVGKLAPMENAERGEDLPPAERKDEEQPDDLVPKGLKPGLEPEKVSDGAESESGEELDLTSNQSLVPSSMGFTFCVDGQAETLDVAVAWGVTSGSSRTTRPTPAFTRRPAR
ncbi:hypothetical protein KGZ78_19210 [Pseudomonas aeruginosa]|nr:hypothetical protein KGZ78_19210 [Pseudomonas aeruginosa]